jgi:hypothetical protein
MDRSMHDSSPTSEQCCDLPDALAFLQVHSNGLGALIRAQRMAAAERHAARLCRCDTCGDALSDEFVFELSDLRHQAEHQAGR